MSERVDEEAEVEVEADEAKEIEDKKVDYERGGSVV
jgi:hypothetical protein